MAGAGLQDIVSTMTSLLRYHHENVIETLDHWGRQHDAKLDRLICPTVDGFF